MHGLHILFIASSDGALRPDVKLAELREVGDWIITADNFRKMNLKGRYECFPASTNNTNDGSEKNTLQCIL